MTMRLHVPFCHLISLEISSSLVVVMVKENGPTRKCGIVLTYCIHWF